MFLGETISILDTKARNEEKENFYHGILIGILKNYSRWAVKSNKESGDGFADILIKPKNPDVGIIIELKYARSMNELDKACERAVEQIKDRRYDTELREDRCDILAYGIAFAGSGAGWLVRSCKLFLLYIRGWYSRLFWRYFYEA